MAVCQRGSECGHCGSGPCRQNCECALISSSDATHKPALERQSVTWFDMRVYLVCALGLQTLLEQTKNIFSKGSSIPLDKIPPTVGMNGKQCSRSGGHMCTNASRHVNLYAIL